MNDALALVYDFDVALEKFSGLTTQQATLVLQEAATTTLEAIVIGNSFGPGVPVDTGWLRASFAAGINSPSANLNSNPTPPQSRGKGSPMPFTMDIQEILRAELGDAIYLTTATEYGAFLEFQPGIRRYGPNPGTSTEFLAPVEARFSQIVDDAVRRIVRP